MRNYKSNGGIVMSAKDFLKVIGNYRSLFGATPGRKDNNERPIYSGVGKNRREAKKKRNKRR